MVKAASEEVASDKPMYSIDVVKYMHNLPARHPPRPPIPLEQEALREAEAAARARAEKAAEAKRLAASIAGTKGEMAKIEEQLQECQRCVCREDGDVVLSGIEVRSEAASHAMPCITSPPCSLPPNCCRLKTFLDSVTPEEWFQSQAAAREARKAALRAEWRAACDALAAHKAEAAAAKQRAEHDMQWARTQQQWERAERAAREAAAVLREALAQQASGHGGMGALKLTQLPRSRWPSSCALTVCMRPNSLIGPHLRAGTGCRIPRSPTTL